MVTLSHVFQQLLRFRGFDFADKAILDFLVPLFLFGHFFALLLEEGKFFFIHLWVPEKVVFDEVVRFEGSFQGKSIMMFEGTCSFHAVFPPVAIVDIAVFPGHLAVLMVGSVFEVALIDIGARYCQFAFTLF